MKHVFLFLFLLAGMHVRSQQTAYPYEVKYLPLTIEQQQVRMAYMDVMPEQYNGQTVLLLHGKNFSGFYWKDVIAFLRNAGCRVVVPDQVGFGLSDKPAISYSFHQLAYNTRKLLDTLGITRVSIIAHSMGGMLATRFVTMYPSAVSSVIYENLIGLEDYKTFVPYRSFDEQYNQERKADYQSMKQYQQTYYPEWKAEYEPYVQAQWDAFNTPNADSGAWASAATYLMIYEQPVLYEFRNIHTNTLIIIGQEDRTVVGKALLSKEVAATHGNYPQLGKWMQREIKNSKLVELKGVGHIPHIQAPEAFRKEVLSFLGLAL